MLTYNTTPPPPTLKDRCLGLGATAVTFIQCNVADLHGCESVVRHALEAHGRVDILINNAGVNVLEPVR